MHESFPSAGLSFPLPTDLPPISSSPALSELSHNAQSPPVLLAHPSPPMSSSSSSPSLLLPTCYLPLENISAIRGHPLPPRAANLLSAAGTHWSAAEKARFFAAQERYGPFAWAAITAAVRTRSAKQVRAFSARVRYTERKGGTAGKGRDMGVAIEQGCAPAAVAAAVSASATGSGGIGGVVAGAELAGAARLWQKQGTAGGGGSGGVGKAHGGRRAGSLNRSALHPVYADLQLRAIEEARRERDATVAAACRWTAGLHALAVYSSVCNELSSILESDAQRRGGAAASGAGNVPEFCEEDLL